MDTGQARLLLADYGTWWQIERHLLQVGQIAYRGALITLVEHAVHKYPGGRAHMVLSLRSAHETHYFRKDGHWDRRTYAPQWFGDFYRVVPVKRETTAYERPAA